MAAEEERWSEMWGRKSGVENMSDIELREDIEHLHVQARES